jgi:hypothetical protein
MQRIAILDSATAIGIDPGNDPRPIYHPIKGRVHGLRQELHAGQVIQPNPICHDRVTLLARTGTATCNNAVSRA